MPQHAKRVKIRRKDLRGPDEFETLTGRAVDWASDNQVTLAVVGAVLVVIAGAVFAFGQWRSSQATQAAVAFDSAYHSLESGKFAAAAQGFGVLVDNYPSTATGRLARLYRAHALLRQDQASAAAAAYDEYLNTGPPTAYLRQEALCGLGHAKEAAGDSGGALDAYRQASEIDGPFQRDALLGIARLQEAAGRTAEAREVYARLLKDTSDPEQRALISSKLGPAAQGAAKAEPAPPAATANNQADVR